ncbi:hypothetical protein AJ79_07889 [Helicocarpus griseus UAMH5409]|uniref:C2 domain-containing protein n=1 Tax=Helicocarpus griseus UAMH5409 TaxID=1447875 RepID=A0A2B7WYD7_9EURO|nr:hypothetical protein AJ79_07889 [Helicocarpus griseus UAMH5409]
MVSKTKLAQGQQLTQHTAGIFADMSVDGPPIGTLVAIIDRAKNLPNRKTMGKQNPYCAARLGKEAKKTETDMRGGQTPKWDQELRFTVHESPDYYQLKVSVFNDDKKTDLIGETWIDIKNVVIPGGGQNDLWHALQYKGKYAGDIRIELTYYDTRPKDDAVIERRKEAEKVEAKAEAANSGVSGPRQAKPSRRRPLPADPTGSSPARPPSSDHIAPPPSRESRPPPVRQQIPDVSQPAPSSHPQRTYETPDDFHRQWGPPPQKVVLKHSAPTHQQSYQNAPSRDIQEFTPQHHIPQPSIPPSRGHPYPPVPEYAISQPVDHAQVYSAEQNGYDYPPDPPPTRDPYQTPPRQNHYRIPTAEQYVGTPSYPPPSRASPYGALDSQGQSLDPLPQPQANPGSGDRHNNYHRYNSSQGNNDAFRDSPLRQSVKQTDYDPRREYMQAHVQDEEEEAPPPPPPVHRQVFQQPPPPPPMDYPRNEMVPVSMPEPLDVSPRRTSPLPINDQQTYIAYSPNYANPNFSSGDREPVYSTSPTPSYNNTYGHEVAYPQDRPNTSSGEVVPSALRPGYETTVTEEQNHAMYNGHFDPQQSYAPPEPTPPAQTMRASPSAIVKRPSRTSPDLRQVPARKSLSPQPPPPAEPGTLSSIPFSPDSYDALNPNASSASALQQPAAPYSTPEEAMEAARMREVEKLRDLGPIIGNDGREIDPSDHLPTDTWAPEPERKSRKPEIVVRFKHAPQNSSRFSPRESSSSTAVRPHSMVGPSSSHRSSQSMTQQPINAGAPIVPSSQHSGRNRLQKQPARPQSYVQPPSRPPKEHTPSPRTSNALRERDPYGYNGNPATPPYHASNSTSYSQASPTPSSHHSPSNHLVRHYHSASTGPPIPAKVPVHPGSQSTPSPYGSGGMASGSGGEIDALSEEMRRIDIGLGAGGTKGGRKGRVSFVGIGSPGYGP